MKSSVTVEDGFKPITVNMTFETKKELDAFFGMINSVGLFDKLKDNGLDMGDLLLMLREYNPDESPNNPVFKFLVTR